MNRLGEFHFLSGINCSVRSFALFSLPKNLFCLDQCLENLQTDKLAGVERVKTLLTICGFYIYIYMYMYTSSAREILSIVEDVAVTQHVMVTIIQ